MSVPEVQREAIQNLERSVIRLSDTIEQLPTRLKELQLEAYQGKTSKPNLDCNSSDESNTDLQPLTPPQSTSTALVQQIARLENAINTQSEQIQKINEAMAQIAKGKRSAHPPLIPVTLVAAIVGAVLTYALLQFFPSQGGILSRINSRVNDIQILIERNQSAR